MVKIKVQASTLIEVLIAMVIIMIVFTLGIRIFNNVLYSSPASKKIQVQQQLDVFSKAVQQKGYLEQPEMVVDSVHYKFTVDSNSASGLKHIEIIASQHDQQLGHTDVLYKSKSHEE
ncbi:type II secretion system protein [Pedobacter cryoconitis]|uniref:Type II secretory pathway component PulJ n=1 Tax=Pedobacter cryoconitis TaxID=188932 RepID=A0A7X0J8A8_9SPHI|nr:prepilin-type N-terminal cleavage/methylation domain-containing protein [Pedobacter cryoconitis]MBB6502650.1 type II secretory pathway component PulJ [Pedobacter cryoconitis]